MLADRKPGRCRITSSVAVYNSPASPAARSGSTVKTLIKVASSSLVSASDRPAQGRARSLELTATGAKRLAAAHAAVMGVESTMTDGISATARRQLAAALTRCAENLET